MKPIQYALMATTVANVGGGITFALLALFKQYPMLVDPVQMDEQSRWHYIMLWAFVAVIGLGYGVASRDPARQTAMLLIGGLGKVTAAAIWAYMAWIGIGSPLVLPAVGFDGGLGIWFLVFVAQTWFGGRTAASR